MGGVLCLPTKKAIAHCGFYLRTFPQNIKA
ncbi:MAG: hypothetical protein RLZZ574_1988 [Cyanobacteriota bacterium]